MRRVVLVLGLLACAGSPTAGSPAPSAPLVAPAPPAAFWTACRGACARKNMMRAVAAWMIDAQCEDACRADWALPERSRRAALADAAGARVRVRGVWRVDGEARAIALEDGAELACRSGVGLDVAGSLQAGSAVFAVGVYADGALTDVAVVASAE